MSDMASTFFREISDVLLSKYVEQTCVFMRNYDE